MNHLRQYLLLFVLILSSLSLTTSEIYADPLAPTSLAVEPIRGESGDLWADVIIGQRDFSEITPFNVVPFKVFNPGGVTVDTTVSPGRAYVWDSGNSRILGINLANCYSKEGPCAADIVLGQPSATGYSAANGDSGFQRYPERAPASATSLCGIAEDTLSILENKSFVSMVVDQQANLFVPDFCNNRILKYTDPFNSDRVADDVWGQDDFSGNNCNKAGGSPTASSLCFMNPYFGQGAGAELDLTKNLWVVDTGNNRLLRFRRDAASGAISHTADLVLGQPDFGSSSSGSALNQLHSPSAARFRSNGWLYVADTDNDRVVIYKPPFSNGMSAASTFGSNFDDPLGLEIDPFGEGVWVNDRGNSMVELWDWDGMTVRKVLGKDTYTIGHNWDSILADGGGGIGIDTQGNMLVPGYVYIQDVLMFRAPIPAPQPGHIIQPDKRLFSPPGGYNYVTNQELRGGEGLAVYEHQLIISDGFRLLFWNYIPALYNGRPADGVIGSSEFSYFPGCCGKIKTDRAGRLWILNYYGEIGFYQLPLRRDSTLTTLFSAEVTLPVLGGGSLKLGRDISGLAPVGQGEFLWITDRANHRVLRIRNPLHAPRVDVILGQKDIQGNQCNQGIIPPPNTGTDLVADGTMLCLPGALSLDKNGNLYISDHSLEVEGNYRMLLFRTDLFPQNATNAVVGVSASKIFPYHNTQPAMTFEPAFDTHNRMVVGYNAYTGTRFVGVYEDPLGPATNPQAYLKDFGSMPFAVAFDRYDNLFVLDGNRDRVLIYWNPFSNTVPPLIQRYLPLILKR